MSKNKKSQKPKKKVIDTQNQTSDVAVEVDSQNQENQEVLNEAPVAEDKTVQTAKEEVVDKDSKKKEKETNNKDNKKNVKKKDKKEKGKLKRKAKETVSELKKVTWPTFGEVCKKTGVVLVVVIVFAVVIFGIDYCLGLLMGLLR